MKLRPERDADDCGEINAMSVLVCIALILAIIYLWGVVK